jgi:hypothetical protein
MYYYYYITEDEVTQESGPPGGIFKATSIELTLEDIVEIAGREAALRRGVLAELVASWTSHGCG